MPGHDRARAEVGVGTDAQVGAHGTPMLADVSLWRERVARHRSRIVLVVLLLVAVYFLAAFGEQALRIRELQAQTQDLATSNGRLRDENSVLSDQLAQWDAGGYLGYVEGRARRDLLLARPDEQVIAVRWHEPAVLVVPQQQTVEPEETSANWKQWLNVLTGADSDGDEAGGGSE